jgi:hypothetical protein
MSQTLSHSAIDLITTYGIHEGEDPQEWQFNLYSGQFPGVRGETHLKDKMKGRDIPIVVRYRGFETRALLEAAMDELEDYKGNDGSLVVDDRTYESCTFASMRRVERTFPDGSGLHGWTVKVLLVFRQREPNAEPEPEP